MSRDKLLLEILGRFSKGEYKTKMDGANKKNAGKSSDLYSKKSFPKDDDEIKRTDFLEKRESGENKKKNVPSGKTERSSYLGNYRPYLEETESYLPGKHRDKKKNFLPEGGYEYKTKLFKFKANLGIHSDDDDDQNYRSSPIPKAKKDDGPLDIDFESYEDVRAKIMAAPEPPQLSPTKSAQNPKNQLPPPA